MDISIQVCADDPEMVKCPRCQKWHYVKYNLHYINKQLKDDVATEKRHIFCDRCADTLITINHELKQSILDNYKWQRETNPWKNKK